MTCCCCCCSSSSSSVHHVHHHHIIIIIIVIACKSCLKPCKGIARLSPPPSARPASIVAIASGGKAREAIPPSVVAAVLISVLVFVLLVLRHAWIPQRSAGPRPTTSSNGHRPWLVSSSLVQIFKLGQRHVHRSLPIHGQGRAAAVVFAATCNAAATARRRRCCADAGLGRQAAKIRRRVGHETA